MSQEMDEMAAQIDAAGTEPEANPQAEQGQPEPKVAPEPEAEPTFDPRQAFEDLKKELNRLNSQAGNWSKAQSEFAKLKNDLTNKQPTNQAPKSWESLSQEERQQTEELIKHLVDKAYGDKFKAYDEVHAGWTERQTNDRIVSVAHEALGADYGKYDAALGEVFSAVKAMASQGDERAAKFLEEIKTTESGVYRMVEMAKANVAKSMQEQSEKAKLEQEAKAKRVSTGVGGSKLPASKAGGSGLSQAEQMAQMAAKLDEAYSTQD